MAVIGGVEYAGGWAEYERNKCEIYGGTPTLRAITKTNPALSAAARRRADVLGGVEDRMITQFVRGEVDSITLPEITSKDWRAVADDPSDIAHLRMMADHVDAEHPPDLENADGDILENAQRVENWQNTFAEFIDLN